MFPGIVPLLHNMNVMYVIIAKIKYGFAVLNVTYRFSYNDQIIIRIVNMWDLHSGRQMHNNFNNFLNYTHRDAFSIVISRTGVAEIMMDM